MKFNLDLLLGLSLTAFDRLIISDLVSVPLDFRTSLLMEPSTPKLMQSFGDRRGRGFNWFFFSNTSKPALLCRVVSGSKTRVAHVNICIRLFACVLDWSYTEASLDRLPCAERCRRGSSEPLRATSQRKWSGGRSHLASRGRCDACALIAY